MANNRVMFESNLSQERTDQDVWQSYKQEPNKTDFDWLVERYRSLAYYTAERLHAKLPVEVDVEDLASEGVFGLMDAIRSFDLNRGVKFETFCALRVRGAILDGLRTADWVPRLVRTRSNRVEKARRRLEMQHGHKPTRDELMQELDVSKDEFEKILKDASAIQMSSLSHKWFETDTNRDVCEIDVIEDPKQMNPLKFAQRRDLKEVITKSLSRQESLILTLYYYEEMTMKEIGATLDLSESRVSQMHSSILARLKAQFQSRGQELKASVH